MKVLLTGPSGNLGSRVLQCILNHDLIPTSDLVLSTTSPEKVYNIAKQNGIDIVEGDFRDPIRLTESFRLADCGVLFLVSLPDPSVDVWLLHKNAIDAARDSGCIKVVVYTSLMYGGETGMTSVTEIQQAHIKTIEYLQQVCEGSNNQIDFVVLRQGIYAEGWGLYAGFQDLETLQRGISEEHAVEWIVPKDGPIAWVGWDDLGEGNAKILAELAARTDRAKSWYGKSLRLTGSRAYSLRDMSEMMKEAVEVPVLVKCVGRDEAVRYHLEHSEMAKELGRDFVESWASWYDAVAQGECAVVDPFLEQVLGRKVEDMRELLSTLIAGS